MDDVEVIVGRVDAGPANGFRHSNPHLEDYLTRNFSTVDRPTGRSLKPQHKAAARSAMSEYLETIGALRHRQVLRLQLEGAGVHPQVVEELVA